MRPAWPKPLQPEMKTPPKRLGPGKARSAATAGLDRLHATRVVLGAVEN